MNVDRMNVHIVFVYRGVEAITHQIPFSVMVKIAPEDFVYIQHGTSLLFVGGLLK